MRQAHAGTALAEGGRASLVRSAPVCVEEICSVRHQSVKRHQDKVVRALRLKPTNLPRAAADSRAEWQHAEPVRSPASSAHDL